MSWFEYFRNCWPNATGIFRQMLMVVIVITTVDASKACLNILETDDLPTNKALWCSQFLTCSWLSRDLSGFFIFKLLRRSRLLGGGRVLWLLFDQPDRQCYTRTTRSMSNRSQCGFHFATKLLQVANKSFFWAPTDSNNMQAHFNSISVAFLFRLGRSTSVMCKCSQILLVS